MEKTEQIKLINVLEEQMADLKEEYCKLIAKTGAFQKLKEIHLQLKKAEDELNALKQY